MNFLILPELILGTLGIVLLILLALGPKLIPAGIHTVVSLLGLLGAGLSSLFLLDFGSERMLRGMLQSDPSFLYLRFGLPILAAALVFMVGDTKEVNSRRKPELCFFIVWLTFFASLLITSKNYFVTLIALTATGAISCLLTAMPFQNPNEGAAAARSWRQLAVALLMGFGVALVFAVLADDLGYDSLRVFFQKDLGSQWIISFLLLLGPFLVVGGLFPFHYLTIGQAYGSAWSIQAVLTILVQGPVALALLKFLLGVFAGATIPYSAPILNIVTALGFIGAFYGGLGAFTQTASKRLMAHLALMQWSIVLVTANNPSAMGLSASIFHALSISLAFVVAFVILAAFHEAQENDSLHFLRGFGGWKVPESLALLAALVSLAGLPPFIGFPAALKMFNAILGQSEALVFLSYVVLFAIQFVVVARLLGMIFFDRSEAPVMAGSRAQRLPMKTKVLFASLVAPLLLMGFFWEGVWQSLVERSGNFIIF